MWFTRISLRNPVMTTMAMMALMVLGVISLSRLKVDQFPRIEAPVVVVATDYPGAPPAVVEDTVSRVIEEAVNSIAGVSRLTSRSFDGQSIVLIAFELDINSRKAADDVRERVASVRAQLGAAVKEPRVIRFDPASQPVWSVALLPSGTDTTLDDPRELTRWAEQVLKTRLESVRGVGAVSLVGASRREIQVQLQPAALHSLGITPDQVAAALRNDNGELPLGALRDPRSERTLQLAARAERPEDLGRIAVARRGTSVIHLDQVARVVDGAEESEALALYNGERTLLLTVQKAQDENTIDLVDRLDGVVQGLQGELPAGLRLVPIVDASREIRVAVANVRSSLLEGAALTVLIVFLFLNSWRSTVITGLTLPIAIVGTFLFMYALGFSINMITLLALSLCVGLLIDDAIVVRENIVRHLDMGKSAFQAALDGTREIALAVTATTLSIVAVFLPIGFMEGIIGQFFHQFGLTVVLAVLISMFVSFTLDPMLSSVWRDRPARGAGDGGPRARGLRALSRVMAGTERFTQRLSEGYQSALQAALARKGATLLLSALLFGAGLFMVPRLGTELLPMADMNELSLNFHTPPGSSLELTASKARQVQNIVGDLPQVRHSLAMINAQAGQGRNQVTLLIALVDRRQRNLNATDIAALLRARLAQVAGVTVTHAGLRDPFAGGKQIDFSITGPDRRELARLAPQVIARLQRVPALVDLDVVPRPDRPTITMQLRPETAGSLGITAMRVADHVRTLVAGQVAGNWRAADDRVYDIVVRLPPGVREQPGQLERLPVPVGSLADGSSRTMLLGQLVRLEESAGPSQLNRADRMPELAFSANAHGRSAGEVATDIRAALQSVALPPGYEWRFGGSTREMGRSFKYALSALAMAVIFIYMILASQFKSFLQPLAIMASLPLTLIGVVAALMAFGSTLSILSAIGVVMLMGLVTKNAILLIDFAQRAREDGLTRDAALMRAARMRLRPILMTTLAMIFGMLPLAFGLSEGSEQRAPMAQAIVGGLITSSLLTLVVVPVIYCYLDDLATWWSARFRPAAAVTPPPPSDPFPAAPR